MTDISHPIFLSESGIKGDLLLHKNEETWQALLLGARSYSSLSRISTNCNEPRKGLTGPAAVWLQDRGSHAPGGTVGSGSASSVPGGTE